MTGGAGARRTGLVVAALLLAACGGDDGDEALTASTTEATTTTSTSPPRPTTTTSTIYAPGSVEAEVEQAYLRSWEVYSEAVYTLVLDEEALQSAFTGTHLERVRAEIQDRIAQGRAAFVSRETDISVEMIDADTALLIDEAVNHQVLIDPETKVSTEPDPNQRFTDVISLELSNGVWRVTEYDRLQ